MRELKSGIVLIPARPHRLESISWGGNVTRERSWSISIVVVTPAPRTSVPIPTIEIYDDASAANKNLNPARRSQGRGVFVARNALILGIASVPKKARSLILGCLRTR